MKRIIIIVSIIAIVVLLGFQLTKNKKTLDSANVVVDRSHIPVAVNVATATAGNVNGSFTMPATLVPFDQATIPAGASGKIISLSINLGSVVSKGQIIGCIDTEETFEKLQAAKISLSKLQQDYERNNILAAAKATNTNAVIDSKYDLDNKKVDIAQLKTQLSNANIVSPISGVITDRKLLAGEYANIGATIATIVAVHQLKAKIYVPENKIFALKMGQKLSIIAEVFPAEKIEGVVNYISPQGDDNHNYLVQLLVTNHNSHLKAGQYVTAKFITNVGSRALQIPQTALVDGFKNPYVYLVQGSKAVEKKIVLGRELGDNVEVLSGLKEGDQVVVNGQINLVNNSSVKVIK
jgi:RND family efflux transporter MFP subunit